MMRRIELRPRAALLIATALIATAAFAQSGPTVTGVSVSATGGPVGSTASPAAPRGLNRGDINLFHCHHGFERAFGRRRITIQERGNQGARSNHHCAGNRASRCDSSDR